MKANVHCGVGEAVAGQDFRDFLQGELARRCTANSQYSLRAFALDLGVDHASLSQQLRGKRRITAEMIRRLGARLGLDDAGIVAYQNRQKLLCNGLEETTTVLELQRLTQYAASVVTEWPHFAILELTRLAHFRPDVGWIGRVLDISPDEVNLAVSRLTYLGMLEMKRDRWVDTCGHSVASVADFAPDVLNRVFSQARQLSSSSSASPADPKHLSSTTIAVNSQRLPEALALIQEFRQRLAGLLERDAARDRVYRLDVQFFPVTRATDERSQDHGQSRSSLADPQQGTG